MGSSRPWIDTARDLIKRLKQADQPVLIDEAVKVILLQHRDCGIPEAELADKVRDLVVQERGSMIDYSPTKPRHLQL